MIDQMKIIEGIARIGRMAIKEEEGDFRVDGRLFCGKCGTPKEKIITIGSRTTVVPILCQCAVEKRDAEEAARLQEEMKKKVSRMRSVGFPDAEMAKWTFEADDHKNEKIIEVAKNYAKNFDTFYKKNKGLMFYGSVGTGKTFAAVCIANALIDDGHPCLVTNFARVVNTIQGMREGKQEYIDGFNEFSLLVIDDLAAERDTEYMNETIMNVIDARYRSGKPMIVTTNLSMAQMTNPQDIMKQRIYSRLFEMCVPVEVTGGDRRKEKMMSDISDIRELLGLK